MVKYLYPFIFLLNCNLYSQIQIVGQVKNYINDTPIINAEVFIDNDLTTFSDSKGFFELFLDSRNFNLKLKHISYEDLSKYFSNVNDTLILFLNPKNFELETITVSTNKFEKKIEDLSISLDVIKGNYIYNQHNYNIENSISQAPSVNIIDGQINIRGGSGWSYGAGSRVLVLLDGISIINSITGAVQWELIPAENIERIEIIKGASSVIFGSSALNGIVNIISKKKTEIPKTNFSSYYGQYSKAKRNSLNWWEDYVDNPKQYGLNFNHSNKIKNFYYDFGLQFHKDFGYMGLISTDIDTSLNIHHLGEERLRIYFNLEHKSKNNPNVNFELKSSFMDFQEEDGFLYKSNINGYNPFSDENYSTFQSREINLAPKFQYTNNKRDIKLSVSSRFLNTNFEPNSNVKINNYSTIYSEYLIQKFLKNATLNVGLNYNHIIGISNSFKKNKFGNNYSFFSQYDKNIGRLKFNLGMRYEEYNIGKKYGKPVLRSGFNYSVNEKNFFRASIGQGYRFPSLFELFYERDAGQISIFSNENLKSESGYSAELGYKYKIQKKNSITYLDLCIYQMRYYDMIELSFGLWGDSTRLNPLGIGLKPINIGDTKISGFDFSVNSNYKFDNINFTTRLSYTYSLPQSVNPNYVYGNFNNRLESLIENLLSDGNIPSSIASIIPQLARSELSYFSTSSNPNNNILKYRYNHLAKLDLEINYKKLSIGTHIRYNSFMKNIDWLFESGAFNSEILDIFTLANANIEDMGIKLSRKKFKRGDFLINFRLSYDFLENYSIQILVENLLNREYQLRPGSIGAPRFYSFRISGNF